MSVDFWRRRKGSIGRHQHLESQILTAEGVVIPNASDEVIETGVICNRASGFVTPWYTLDAGQVVCLYYRKIGVTAFDLDGEIAGEEPEEPDTFISYLFAHEESEDGVSWDPSDAPVSGTAPVNSTAVGVVIRHHRWRMVIRQHTRPGGGSVVSEIYDGANDPAVIFDLHLALT